MNLKTSILKTIAFFDLFDFPLTAEEVQERLYQYNRSIHIKEIKGTLKQMVETEKLETLKDYYVLKGRTELIGIRKARKFIAEKFWNRVNMYKRAMQIPFVEMVAVCNNLAYDNVDESSDIDLFIVVKPGRMWMARLLITLKLHFFGVRRHGDNVAGRFCLSFFVTTKKLNIGELQIEPEDPYLAFWTQTLAPVYGEKMYEKFKRVNEGWLRSKYGLSFPNSSKRHLAYSPDGSLKRAMTWVTKGKLGDWKEKFIKAIFKKRTQKRQKSLGQNAGVIVTDDMLKFHNSDKREEFLREWKLRLK